ncbi:MAG: type I-U CRISPR-associated protein Cas7 [Planctomycetes bacterium]|nr:type I-U CRISPR-associated protein Cas7 [Planctomycetota bacterium]
MVESPQSVANRMEMTCWDGIKQDLISELRGMPFIRIVDDKGQRVSNSLLEAHRINSEYIMDKKKDVRRVVESANGKPPKLADTKFRDDFIAEIEYQSDGRVNWEKFRKALFKYDPNSLIHGCFLEEIGGRLRVARALSAFIEAIGVGVAESGGVKNNIVQPELKGGEGNVPYHRTEFTAEKITAYFNLDLSLLRSYGFDDDAHQFLIALALFKIRRFLSTELRLRTACDLEPVNGLHVIRPKNGLEIPPEKDLLDECTTLIAKCTKAKLFADPHITEVQWKK